MLQLQRAIADGFAEPCGAALQSASLAIVQGHNPLGCADYMRAAIRMAALSHAGVLFVTTHDSIGLGEDGPTHQPVEHLASFRAMPNVVMLRPGDGVETSGAYKASAAESLQ